jgi:hypothetical protein
MSEDILNRTDKFIAKRMKVYPSLFSNRLAVLSVVFGGHFTFRLDTEGYLQEDDDGCEEYVPYVPEYERPPSHELDLIKYQWISDNSDRLAKSSAHDKFMDIINPIILPCMGNRFKDTQISELSDEVREILLEYARRVERVVYGELTRKKRPNKRLNFEDRWMIRGFNVNDPGFEIVKKSVDDTLFELTGRTREERLEQSKDFMKKVLDDLNATMPANITISKKDEKKS